MNEPKQDHPEAQASLEAADHAKATDHAEAPRAADERKEMRPDAAAPDETVVDPDTRLRDVLIGPAAGRRLE